MESLVHCRMVSSNPGPYPVATKKVPDVAKVAHWSGPAEAESHFEIPVAGIVSTGDTAPGHIVRHISSHWFSGVGEGLRHLGYLSAPGISFHTRPGRYTYDQVQGSEGSRGRLSPPGSFVQTPALLHFEGSTTLLGGLFLQTHVIAKSNGRSSPAGHGTCQSPKEVLSRTCLPKEPFCGFPLIGLFYKFENPRVTSVQHKGCCCMTW